MFTSCQLRRLLPCWVKRGVAFGFVALIGLMTLASASPEIHAALHADQQEGGGPAEPRHDPVDQADPGHSCVVKIFSQGVESGLGAILPVGVPALQITDVMVLSDQVARSVFAVLLPPGRGPPNC